MAPPSVNPDARANPELSVIVVSYGTREMTAECLASVVGETRETNYDVVVIDNASTDGSAELIAARFPAFNVIAETSNLGFAAAANRAAARANGRYLLLLNPDTVVLDHGIDRLMAFARQRPRAGIWGGRTFFADGTPHLLSSSRRPSLWSFFCVGFGLNTRFPDSPLFHSRAYGGWKRDYERNVDVVTGSFLLIDRVLWDRLGGFAPEFFMYGEDVDLCLRARRLGYRPAVTPDATIVHHGSGTEPNQARKLTQIFAAEALLIRRHIKPAARALALAFLALRPLLGSVLASDRYRPLWRQVWRKRQQWLAGRY